MPQNTPNLVLTCYDLTTDAGVYFSTFRNTLAGYTNSALTKIDTWAGTVNADLTALKQVPKIYKAEATKISDFEYETTISELTQYTTGMFINLSLDFSNVGTVTLQINNLGVKSVMKVNASGTLVNVSANDLRINKRNLFTYNGTAWIWVNAVSSDQLNVTGTTLNLTRISANNTLEDAGVSFAPTIVNNGIPQRTATGQLKGTVAVANDDVVNKLYVDTIDNKIGVLSTLTTTNKTSVVNAINENVGKITTIEGKINTPSSSTPIDATTPIISLPSTAVKGKLEGSIKGNTLYQSVVNGDFANGVTGWTAFSAVTNITKVGEDLKFDVAAGNSIIGNIGKTNGKTNDKFYIAFEVFAPLGMTFDAYLRTATAVVTSFTTPSSGTGVAKVSATVTANQDFINAGLCIRKSSPTDAIGNITLKKGSTKVIPITGTPYENWTADQINTMINGYWEGLGSAEPSRVKSVGVNLFDINSNVVIGNYYSTTGAFTPQINSCASLQYVKIKKTQAYAWNGTDKNLMITTYDKDKKFIERISVYTVYTKIFNDNVSYVRFSSYDEGFNVFENFIFNEGITALPYEPYEETELYCPVELKSVPNGIKDEFYWDGKHIKNAQEYTLLSGDIISLNTTYTNIDLITTKVFTDAIVFTGVADGKSAIIGYKEKANTSFDNIANVGNYAARPPKDFVIIVAKGTYATLAQAKTALAGTKIIYQLATPIETQYPVSALQSNPSGTIYIDNAISGAMYYATGITLAGKVFSSIDKVTKVDKVTGIETDITTSCTLNVAKDGFTSTVALATDLLWFSLETVAEGVVATTNYSYPLNIAGAVSSNSESVKQLDEEVKNLDTRMIGANGSITEVDNKIGILSALTTIDKTSVVGAINENSSAIGQIADQPRAKYVAITKTTMHNTWATLEYPTKIFDSNAFVETDKTKFIIKKAGTYLLNAFARFASSGSGERGIRILKNANTDIAYQSGNCNGITNNYPYRINVSTLVYLDVGDFVQVLVYQSSGVNLDVLGIGLEGDSNFSIIRISN